MQANHIRYCWKDADGTLHYEDLQLLEDNENLDIVSIETLVKGVG